MFNHLSKFFLGKNKNLRNGKEVYRRSNIKGRSFPLIREWFDKEKKDEFLDAVVDDCTWNDLNMNTLYEKMDFTSTTAGEQMLYSVLRNPCYKEEELNKREEIFKYFKENKIIKDNISKELFKIGSCAHNITESLDSSHENSKQKSIFFSILALIYLISLISFIATWSKILLFITIGLTVYNIFLHFKVTFKYNDQIESLLYLGKVVNSIKNFQKLTENTPYDVDNRFDYLDSKLTKIGDKTKTIARLEGLNLTGDYINIVFLIKERKFFQLVDDLKLAENEIYELHELIGLLDAYLSVVDYRDSLDSYCIPEFTDEKFVLEAVDVNHPLLVDGVCNSFKLDSKGIAITGSNMSGKSTFLRTIGINAITGQTINTCSSEKFKSSFYKIISSISLSDDINDGRSYYHSEAEAIKRVVKESNGDVTILSLVDEIFKGTNPVERISAASEILNYISCKNVVSFVTTHDMNLLPLLESYNNYFFTETIENNTLNFDYKIREGISPNGNATKILEIIGYPSHLIKRIYNRIEKISDMNVS